MNRRQRNNIKQVLLGLALVASTFAVAGGLLYADHQSYLHHNPDLTTADWLYGERK